MEQKILSYCRAYGLFSPGERVAVAVSGGADSMALLTALLALREQLNIVISAAHFHHGIRGQEADRDTEFVTQWCRAQGVPLTVGRGDVPARARDTGESMELAARNLRYEFFAGLPADKIATAHNADDNAETLLLHLLRGTGLRGLCGIPPQRGKFVRPLLEVSRQEIEVYLTQNLVPHVEDSTNAEDDCLRNRLRHRVIPALKEENPSLLAAIGRTTAHLRQEETYLAELAARAEQECRKPEGYDCKRLCALPPVLRRRVLLSLLERLRLANPSAVYVTALERLVLAENPSGEIHLPGDLILRRQYDILLLPSVSLPKTFPPTPLTVPGLIPIPALGATVRCFVTKNLEIRQKNPNIFYLKYDMISQALTVRPRTVGDTIRLRGGTKTLKRLMIDRKIPAARRNALPVIVCGEQVVAVCEIGTDVSATAAEGEPALVIAIEKSGCPLPSHKISVYDTE